MPHLIAYSFVDVSATFSCPGGIVRLGNGAAVADEGISVEKAEDYNTMIVGTEGDILQCRHSGTHGTIRIRLLKHSESNGQLMNIMKSLKGSEWGIGNFSVRNRSNGDSVSAAEVAFTGPPALVFGKIAGMLEWLLHAGHIDPVLFEGSQS